MINVQSLFDSLSQWPLAASNFQALSGVETDVVDARFAISKMHNPARVRSTAAKVSTKEVAQRPCFLCDKNRPAEQNALDWGDYQVLVNPFPIFQHHLTIVNRSHVPQSIKNRVGDMSSLATELPGFTVFFNGAKCGASAPDHMHFQAGDASFAPSPLESLCLDDRRRVIFKSNDGVVEVSEGSGRLVYCLWPVAPEAADALFDSLCALRRVDLAMINVLAHVSERGLLLLVVPRREFRPSCFYEPDDSPRHFLVSPAAVEVSGIFVLPRKSDYDRFSPEVAHDVVRQVCYASDDELFFSSEVFVNVVDGKPQEPLIHVGILQSQSIKVALNGPFVASDSGMVCSGNLDVSLYDGQLYVNGECRNGVSFAPVHDSSTFCLHNVQIGIGFHWDQRESQTFVGELHFVVDNGALWAVNHVSVESYLRSVISSEMSATSDLELLKAHAVASRSWLMAQVWGKGQFRGAQAESCDGESIAWRDREDHQLFDVCADDHCQRYQGVGRATSPMVDAAIEATRGQLLIYEGRVCDARFSKCCGGQTELFETCWGGVQHPYLQSFSDFGQVPSGFKFPLSDEGNADAWIRSQPDAFCNTADSSILSQVLNSYDQKTADFFRWRVSYSARELSDMVRAKSGVDFGLISKLKPIKRGLSCRIEKLLIVGSRLSLVVGKELEIRRWLSPTHLYSSAFVVDASGEGEDRVFVLSGAGWGHGVGLCQIGAAVMAHRGFNYRSILYHYFRRAQIKKMW